jgi:hypothetical protein
MQKDVRKRGASGRKPKSEMLIACEILSQETKEFLPTQRKCKMGCDVPEVHVADILTTSTKMAKRIVNHIPKSQLTTIDPEEVARLQLAGYNGLDVLLFHDPKDKKLKLFPTPADMQKDKHKNN